MNKLFSNLNATHKGLILVLVPVFFELCFVVALGLLLLSAEKDFDDLRHSKEAILALRREQALAMRIGLDLTTQLDQQTPEQLNKLEQAAKFFKKPNSVFGLKIKLFPEVKDLAQQAAAVDAEMVVLIESARTTVANHGARDPEKPRALNNELMASKDTLARLMLKTMPLSKKVVAIEERVHGLEPQILLDFKNTLTAVIAGGLLLSFAISLGVAALISKDVHFRLKTIAEKARLLASRQALPQADQGSDEIAELDRALHQAWNTLNYAGLKERAILDNAAAVICTLDRRLKFVAVNDTAHRRWHYETDQLLGQSLFSLLKPDKVDETRKQLSEIARGKGQGTIETDICCPDGALITSQWHIHWLVEAEKEQYYCVVHDVTELRATERFKQQILAFAGHDLRAPLTAAGINLSLLVQGNKGEITEATRDELQNAQQKLGKLMQLVNNLLQLEKLGSASFALDSTCISAANVFAEAKQAVRSQADLAAVTIKGPVGDAALLADESRLIEAAINLLSNAIKFSPPGSCVQLSIVGSINGGPEPKLPIPCAELRVTDQGPGIAREEQALIFGRFHQRSAIDISASQIRGTGLGLAIVKAIVTAHGGACGVESEGGNGSTFWLRIPEFYDQFEEDM